MIFCEKCKTPFPYGAKYCVNCGEKIPKEAHEEEYKDTIWAKFDKVKDEYDKFFLKKITGNIVFKTVVMLAVVGYFFFTLYGNFMGVRLEKSEAYTIQYNEQADEYYIHMKNDVSKLELYIPIGTEKIVFQEVKNEIENTTEYSPDEYEAKGYSISADKHDYILVDAVRKDKTIDSVKVVVMGKEGA